MEKIPTNKKESGMSRIVGVEESVEQELLGYFQRQFEKDQRDNTEQEHTPELGVLISQINEKMKKFLVQYGIQALDIPGRNIHVVDKSKLSPQQLSQLKERYEKISGIYLPNKQQIGVLESYTPNNKLHFAQILIHEMIHMNAFASAQKVKEGGIELTKDGQSVHLDPRRMGFEIDSTKTGKKFFYDINEAITTELSMRFDNNYFSQFEDLKQEYEERKEAIEAVAKRSGKGEHDLEWLIANLEHNESDAQGSHKVILRTYSYHDQREKLNQLINDLYEKNKTDFKSPEEVFTLFATAALNGRLLPIARLIENTYGKGSFRNLAEKTAK